MAPLFMKYKWMINLLRPVFKRDNVARFTILLASSVLANRYVTMVGKMAASGQYDEIKKLKNMFFHY